MTFCWYFRCWHRTDTRLIISSVALFKSKQQAFTWFTKKNQWVWTDYLEPLCFKSISYVDEQGLRCVPRGRAMRDQICLWCAEAYLCLSHKCRMLCSFPSVSILWPLRLLDAMASWTSSCHLSSLLSGYTLLSTRAMVQDTLNVPKGLVYPLIPNYVSSLRHLHLKKGQHPQLADILFLDLLHPTQHVLLFLSKPYSNPFTSQHLCPAPNPYLCHH